jgi:nickel-dependent lactate racemase
MTMSNNTVFKPVAGRLVIPSPDEPAGIDEVTGEPVGAVVETVVPDAAVVVVREEAAVVVVTALVTQALLTILFESRVTAPLRASN